MPRQRSDGALGANKDGGALGGQRSCGSKLAMAEMPGTRLYEGARRDSRMERRYESQIGGRVPTILVEIVGGGRVRPSASGCRPSRIPRDDLRDGTRSPPPDGVQCRRRPPWVQSRQKQPGGRGCEMVADECRRDECAPDRRSARSGIRCRYRRCPAGHHHPPSTAMAVASGCEGLCTAHWSNNVITPDSVPVGRIQS